MNYASLDIHAHGCISMAMSVGLSMYPNDFIDPDFSSSATIKSKNK